MTKVNPFLDFLKSVDDPKKALLQFDVDLAIQPSMSTFTTDEQKNDFWELYDRTEGGVLILTGREAESVRKTFGHEYAGVFEHYSVARFGLGQTTFLMCPEMDVQEVGNQAQTNIAEISREVSEKLGENLYVRIAETPDNIRVSEDLAVFIEKKQASVALVHTLSKHGTEQDAANHLAKMRTVLQPVAQKIITSMGLGMTHHVKTGNDAVEIVPLGLDVNSKALLKLPESEIIRLKDEGLSKATAIHNFQFFYPNRVGLMTGDSAPDLDAMIELRQYGGKGLYVANGHRLADKYAGAVDYHIEHHTMTWPLISDTAAVLREMAPIVKTMPPAGGGVPDIGGLN